LNNNAKDISLFLIAAVISHFVAYGFAFLSCLKNDICFYYHNSFFYIYPENSIFLEIYLKTFFFYIIIALIFFLSTRLNFLNQLKFSNEVINFNKKYFTFYINSIFIISLIIFIIINYKIFWDYKNFFISFRYRFDPTSLTFLWLLGFSCASLNLMLKKNLISFFILTIVITFLYLDGSRLWVLIIFSFFSHYFYIKLKLSFKFILVFIASLILSFFIYTSFMSNPSKRVYFTPKVSTSEINEEKDIKLKKEKDIKLKKINCNFSKIKSITISEKNSFDQIILLSDCESLKLNKQFIFAYINKKLEIDALMHVLIAQIYKNDIKLNFFSSTLNNLGFVFTEAFQELHDLSERIVKANNLKEAKTNLNLNIYAGFTEMYPSFLEKLFFLVIFSLLVCALFFLLNYLNFEKETIKFFLCIHLFFFLSMGATNPLRASIKFLIVNIIILIIFFFIYFFIKKINLILTKT
jgi:hypothetical protein